MRHGWVFGLGLIGLLARTVAAGPAAPPVIGGAATPAGGYPGVGALLMVGSGGSSLDCTGTLIAPSVVLTAAHCLRRTDGALPIAFTLAHDVSDPAAESATYAIRGTYGHPQYAGGVAGLGHVYDIALVFLAQPVPAAAAEPVKLVTPDLATALATDTELRIVGYGQTADADPSSTGVMFDAATGIREIDVFEMRVSSGTPEPQQCYGDSGGPAFATFDGRWYQVGIASRSYQGSTCTTGAIDTRVDAYLDWIVTSLPPDTLPCGSGQAEACPVDDGGCCSTGADARAPGALAVGAAVAAVLARRRRR